ncbi:unnamed protein product [Vitrella brassicaformis CCMP3155]|uniref:Nucleoside phosphorylase domain-containing protein n=2 Tax=Vitrella brassicaformis TaxID=1169539 RepID=A0A0G4GRX3_VITBC|nr:unnamed protein product [Vitrella brassicaformis CCMP3155]|eukprot:CEM33364.1 unnamed protein product [Vitrella brassicaformis CCMP3155]
METDKSLTITVSPRSDEMLGIIGGSGLWNTPLFKEFQEEIVRTEHGRVKAHVNRERTCAFIQRHNADPDTSYTQPHLINRRALCGALKKLGVTRVVCFSSVGSLKPDIHIGTVLIPNDYFAPWSLPGYHTDHKAHFIPSLDTPMRRQLLELLHHDSEELQGVTIRDGGCYTQSKGPRFETKSEIRFYQDYGDVVGMTTAGELTLLQELNLDYACICMVDNMAHGVTADGDTLTLKKFRDAQDTNQEVVETIAKKVLERFLTNDRTELATTRGSSR